MKVKINRKEYEITTADKFLDNGACVQLLTQSKEKTVRFWKATPRLPKCLTNKIMKLKLVDVKHGYGEKCRVFYISQESLDSNKEL
jgi:hypothetical protein